MALADLGSCWSCIDDLTMPATTASGYRVVAEAIARRWNTPRGGLVDDPNYGFDLSNFLQADLDRADISRIAKQAAAEATKDERVLSCDVEMSLSAAGVLTVTGRVKTAAGPFQLVVGVSNVSVSLLSVSGAT